MYPRFTRLTTTALLCAATAAAPQQHAHPRTATAGDTTIARKLGATATELRLAGGDLHVISLYKLQAEALHATTAGPAGRRSRREPSPPSAVDDHVPGVGDALRSTRVPQERSDEDCPSLE